MSEFFEVIPIEREATPEEKIGDFIEKNRETIAKARSLFHAEKSSEFFSIKEVLLQLSEEYKKGNEHGESLPYSLMDEIVGGEYVENEEKLLKSINESPLSGMYRPYEAGGGGDFWIKTEDGGGVGFADVKGHGLDLASSKVFVSKALRLLKENSGKSMGVLPELDAFLSEVPFDLATEYLEVNIERSSEGGVVLAIQAAGDVRILLRNNDTGELNIVTPDTYRTLGYSGNIFPKLEKKELEKMSVGENVDIYIASDGLWDMRRTSDGKDFKDELIEDKASFQLASLTPEEFYKWMVEEVDSAKNKGGVKDDVTMLRLPARNGKMENFDSLSRERA